MLGDVIQSKIGWFYRDNGDSTFDSMSELDETTGTPLVTAAAIQQPATVIVRSGVPTGDGDPHAARLAAFLVKKRYAGV